MLTREGCRRRQERFRAQLTAAGLPGAVISAPRDIYYFTGLLAENQPSLLYLGVERPSWLATWQNEGDPLVDARHTYDWHLNYTMHPDPHARLADRVRQASQALPRGGRLGYQVEGLPFAIATAVSDAAAPDEWVPVDEILVGLQCRKDPDEIDCIRRATAAVLAGYERATAVIRPGLTEVEVLTECQQAAQRRSGAVHYYAGDFRSGEFGGPARDRAIEAGELYIIDAQADVDGYWCDLSRTWSVGGEPTKLQQEVYDHLTAVLRSVPEMVRPGMSCTAFWHALDARIREHPHLAKEGLIHHGGHGVGLRCHEAPDLNRDRDALFEVGNVISCEPGGYSPELRQGVRVENSFWLTENGVETLSESRMSLIPGGLNPAFPQQPPGR
jgi:Xaa-Pro dipeptidase